jgi:hypothetical protein
MKKTLQITALAVSLGIAAATVASVVPADAARYVKGAATETDPITYAVAGDSITCDPYGWDDHQVAPTLYKRVGGYCHGGYTSGQVLDAITPATGADVSVIMVGTNNVREGADSKSINIDVVSIAQKLGANHVIVAALPPSDIRDYGPSHIDRARFALIVNRDLQATAARHGWLYVDPFAAYRYLDGTWAPGAARDDGVHPVTETAHVISQRVDEAMEIAIHGSAR